MACAIIVLALILASIGSISARGLHQHSQAQLAGRKFSFERDGGASTYLQKLQQDRPQVLQQLLQRAANVLPGEAGRSAAAVTRKGQRVGAAAASAQQQEQAAVELLAQHLDQDAGLGIDLDNSALVYECPGIKLDPKNLTIGGQELTPAEPDPLASQAFQLSSRSSASRKVYLDFTGGAVTGTAWNKAYPNIVIPAFDIDGKPGDFSVDERNAIVAVWRSVSEDYSIFDVDITTIRPATMVNAVHVRIGGDGGWYGGGAGGIAYLGIFGDPRYATAFIFPKNLGPDYPKFMAEAVSHEAGHTLGLMHDGDASSAYFSGQGDWASIMGVGYYKQLSTWDNGAYLGSNNPQDDVQIITNFLPLLKQPAGSSISTATPTTPTVNGATATINTTGLVVTPGTPNVWSFEANAGTATFTVAVQRAWEEWAFSDLDVQLVVYDAAGSAVSAPINPAGVDTDNGLGIAAAAVALPAAGTYYVAVSGAGSGDPKDGSSYSSYGSRGGFALSASFPAAGVAQQEQQPSPSPSLSPDGSSEQQQQQQNVETSPSPSPDQQPVGDDTPAQLALLSQFPDGYRPLFSPALWANSARDNCIRVPSSQIGIDGVAVATPGDNGKCSTTVLPGAYNLASEDAPDGMTLARWQCYDLSDGVLGSPATGENVFLEPESITTCVAVFEPVPPAPVQPSPSPELPNTFSNPDQPNPNPSPEPNTQGPTTSNQPKPTMRVTSIIMGKSCAKTTKACSCTAKVLVVASDTGKPVRGATVSGTWRSRPEAWSPIVQTKNTAGKGQAVFTARRQQSGSCSFVVIAVSSPKFDLDRSNSLRTSNLQLQARKTGGTPKRTPPAMIWPSPKP
ncbi:hypothetical protein OEZ85_009038 [Tetradesmus obliquus]|uniref:Peptidase C-terminal archaeal/bacterial domain-containing protein n=1 Tax=Tetradesmus obliquus TaxID=3088 RepID=A0ABY8TMU6_TETOB|nr:hypothetical protein OEZ85_009038 [Tetradesmus obliquus]